MSNYSNASTFGKAALQRGEDFNDDVDEYENDSNSHRLSIVKRYNIHAVLFSPGS